ncbi:MAG: LamG domain-containing protein, partial [Planctomycetota bacterium]|nr:LamG domain-containing protein [Planctomycetota bacterium]
MKQVASAAGQAQTSVPLPDIGTSPCTIAAWVRTETDGPIVGKTAEKGAWIKHGKALFIRNGRLAWDIGWVGCVEGENRVADDTWHHVAVVAAAEYTLYVDGNPDRSGALEGVADPKGSVLKIGRVSADFPEGKRGFLGAIDDVRVYARALDRDHLAALAAGKDPAGGGLVAHWTADGNTKDASVCGNHAEVAGRLAYTKGRSGKAFEMDRDAWLIVRCADAPRAGPWAKLAADYTDKTSRRQMNWEREDGIWAGNWKGLSWRAAAQRYAAATARPSQLAERVKALAAEAETVDDLRQVRRLYLTSRRCGSVLDEVGATGLDGLRGTIGILYADAPARRKALLARLDALELQAAGWAKTSPSKDVVDRWKTSVRALRRNVLLSENPLIDFDKLLFIKRYTFQSSHFYTDFIDGCANYGGNLCVLDLKTGEATDLVPEMRDGIFDRF